MAAKKIALFIDADNVSPRFGKQIFDSLTNRGEIFIRRIYGNWEKNILHGWNECILNFSLRAVQQPDFTMGKNATDMSLAIDAMDVLYGGQANIFVLVSNDSDFTPLVIRLREGGMTVIGFGNENASISFRNACNEFVELEKISLPETPPVEKILPVPVVVMPKATSIDERQQQSDRDKKIQQIHNVLHETAKIHGNENGFVPFNVARQNVKKKNFSFTVHDFGYAQLREFIAAFPKLYDVLKDETGIICGYRCRAITPRILDTQKITAQIHDTLREAAQNGDAQGFTELTRAGEALGKKNLSVIALNYPTLQNFIETFPKLYEVKKLDNSTSYRCLTVTQIPADKKISPQDKKIRQFHDALREAAQVYGDTSGFADLCSVGSFIKGKNFSVKETGYDALQKFIAAFPDLYELRTSKDKAFIRLRTTTPISAVPKTSTQDKKIQQIHATLREVAKTYGDKKGFVDLGQAGNSLIKKNLSIKEFGHSKLSKFIAAFPNQYELKTNLYRCK